MGVCGHCGLCAKDFFKRKVGKNDANWCEIAAPFLAKCCELEGPPEIPQKPFEFHRMVHHDVTQRSAVCPFVFPKIFLTAGVFFQGSLT